MRAAQREQYGSPDVVHVRDVAVPTPADDELLVKVHAATVSRTDCALLAARPPIMRLTTGLRRPRIMTLGTDFAGRVEAVGARVSHFRVGDSVWGINDMGARSHAEYLVISKDDAVAPMPAGLSFEDAAACLEGGWYAYSVVDKVELGEGKRVLINGATGAIGSALLQLSVHRGATVTAVGNTRNLGLLRSLGAHRVIDYEQTDFTTDDRVYDYIFDAVGKSTFGACKHLLAPDGVYVSTELGPGCQNVLLALVTPALRKKRVIFPIPIDRKRFLEAMGPLAAGRHFRPVTDRTFTLDTIREAYTYVASGQKTGSVLLKL
ncbi:NAD(P)-dependent alcohol dehydrogenase [Sorangium sp. So ce1036]|uniref:NAD(P)-dependent alcohol dehydrogenase n=1 Tax=Sorangium sp. So ce1036 TaxID=3133328 RepID=UPI003F00195F